MYFKRIRDLREDNDKTQGEIADILETSRQQYALWESGKREIPISKMIVLSRFYGVSIDYLAGLCDRANFVQYDE